MTMLKSTIIIFAFLFGNLLFTAMANAAQMSGGGYTIHATVMGSAATMNGTMGETFVGRTDDLASGGSTESCAGFWCMVEAVDGSNVWLSFYPGLNLFGYPVELSTAYLASDLLTTVTNASEYGEVMRYNDISMEMESRDTADVGLDYDIVSGEGYFLYLNEAKVVHFQGPKVCQDIVFNQGLNLVSFPCPPAGYTASDLVGDLGGAAAVASVQRLDPEIGAFETLASDGTNMIGKSFRVLRGEAYLVNLTGTGTTISFP